MYKISTALLLLLLIATPFRVQSQNIHNQKDEQGKKHGTWVKKYPNGQVQYQGHFEHGQPSGTFHRYFPDGDTMAIMDHSHPKGVYTQLFNKKGQKQAEGLYIDQKKDSTWMFYNEKGQVIMQESYEMGKRDGRSVKFFPNADTSHVTTWQDGKKHGIYKAFFPNGRLKLRAHYKEDELQGNFTIFFPNGFKEIIGSYRNNLRHGKWIYMENRTDTARVVQYQDGEPGNEQARELKEHKEIEKLENNQGKFGDPREVVMPQRRRRRNR